MPYNALSKLGQFAIVMEEELRPTNQRPLRIGPARVLRSFGAIDLPVVGVVTDPSIGGKSF